MGKPHEADAGARHAAAPSFMAPPVALLDAPLEYILADHKRQRAVCGVLHEFALLGRAERSEAERIACFLAGDLALHIQDEEEDLFAVVRRRALAEDGLGPLLVQLGAEHQRNRDQVARLVAILRPSPASDTVEFSTDAAARMSDYAAREQRHLALENGILLPIARKRLTSGDLKVMSQSMKARRGVRH